MLSILLHIFGIDMSLCKNHSEVYNRIDKMDISSISIQLQDQASSKMKEKIMLLPSEIRSRVRNAIYNIELKGETKIYLPQDDIITITKDTERYFMKKNRSEWSEISFEDVENILKINAEYL